MSKAFTREDDSRPEQPELIERAEILPEGTRNYLTPGGARTMRAELEKLAQAKRAGLTKSEIAVLDRRFAELQEILQTAEVLPPPSSPRDRVRFGATVTVRDRTGEESCYRIVGAHETDLEQDWVSWLSPIARALLNARLGQRVGFKFPAGETELEIVRIEYQA